MMYALNLFEPILRWWRHNMGLGFQDFEKKFHKRIFHFKVSFAFDFHLSITISTWGTSLGSFLTQIWVNVVTTGNQNFKLLRERFRKRVIHLKVFFTFDFHLSIDIGTWNTSLDLFELGLEWQSPHGMSKL